MSRNNLFMPIVSARSPRIGPKLSAEGTETLAAGSHKKVIPEGEASGKRVDSRATDEFKGRRLCLRVSRRNRLWLTVWVGLPTFSVWLTPNACGITQISLLLATPGGQRSWALVLV